MEEVEKREGGEKETNIRGEEETDKNMNEVKEEKVDEKKRRGRRRRYQR